MGWELWDRQEGVEVPVVDVVPIEWALDWLGGNWCLASSEWIDSGARDKALPPTAMESKVTENKEAGWIGEWVGEGVLGVLREERNGRVPRQRVNERGLDHMCWVGMWGKGCRIAGCHWLVIVGRRKHWLVVGCEW